MVATGLSTPASSYEIPKTDRVETSSQDTSNVVEEINFETEEDDNELNVFEENSGEVINISTLEDDGEYDTPSFLRSKDREK